MPSVVGSGSAAATSVAIPAHQAGDLILVFARGTAAAPTVPTVGGTVPAWTTLQSGIANSMGLTCASFVATAAGWTTGVWTNATDIAVLVLRPVANKKLLASAATSSVTNGTNVATVDYPALTLARTNGTSYGVRASVRVTPIASFATTPPTGWTNQIAQPAGTSGLVVHVRAALAVNPVLDTVSPSGAANAAFRSVTIEVQESPIYTDTASGGPIGAGTRTRSASYSSAAAGGPAASGTRTRSTSYASSRSGGPMAAGTALEVFTPPPWEAPDRVDDLWLARLAFPEAQRLLAEGTGRGVARLAVCGWHGTSVDPERGSVALAQAGGPLAGLVGSRVRIVAQADRTRVVYALVTDTADVLEDVSVSRRLFSALALLADGEVAVTVEAAA